MRPESHRLWKGLALAVIGVLLGLGVRSQWLGMLGTRSPFMTFYLVVALVSLYGGLIPGIVATILSCIAASYWMEPVGHLLPSEAADWVRTAGFAVTGIVIASVCEAMHKASTRARQGALAQKQHQDLEMIFNSISHPVWFVDAQMQVTFANLAAQKAFGVASFDELDLETFVHTVDLRREDGSAMSWRESATLRALHGETVYNHPLRVRMPGYDNPRDCLVDITPVRDDTGQVVGAITLLHDVTLLKQVEVDLRQSETEAQSRAGELAALLDAVPALVFIAQDPDCRHMTSSRRTREVLRLQEGTNVSKSAPELERPTTFHVLQNGVPVPVPELPLQKAAATGQAMRDVELTLAFEDGSHRDIYGDAVPLFDAQGHVRGAVGAFLDITGRKLAEEALRESEERLRLFIEHAPASLAMFDRQMRYLSASHRWCSDLGVANRDLRGLCHYDVFPDVPQRWKELHQQGLAGEVLTAEEDPFVRSDGSVQWLRWELRPWRNAAGDVGGIVIFMEDITAAKVARERLKEASLAAERAQAAAEDASRAKDHFLAVLSHELRTPLTPALATVGILQSDPHLDAATQELLEVVRRNCELEALLIDDLLDVTRIAQGKMQLQRQAVDLRTVLQYAVDVCRPDMQARQLDVSLDIAAEPCMVEGDPLRLQQVFWNLIKNSIKFTDAGGWLRIRCCAAAGEAITEVADSGLGIEPAMLPRIFNAFEQGGVGTTRQFGGLGLGLSISRAMVQLHGGEIEAKSEGKGKGATFTVRLPLMQAAVPQAASTVTPTPSPTGLRVLLVEDHGDTARILTRLLARKGYIVSTAGDVATGLRLASENEFDLLLSDLGLPDGSGIDLMSALRARGNPIPGIALSGYGQEQDIERSKAAGFAIHLTKPATPDRLYQAIASLWNAR